MSINPIIATRLKTWVLVGHSRADGWGQSDYLFVDHADLVPISAGDVSTSPATAYWKDIFVATSPQPFPGAGHTPTVANVGDVQWLELTIANVKSNGDAHPHAHPYNYPNNRGSCYPRYFYNAWIVSGFDGFHHGYRAEYSFNYDTEAGGPFQVGETINFTSPVGQGVLWSLVDNGATGSMVVELTSGTAPTDNTNISGATSLATALVDGAVTRLKKFNGTLTGMEIPMCHYWRNYWGDQTGLVKMAFSSSLMLPAETGTPAAGWLDPDLGGNTPASAQVGVLAVPSSINVNLGAFNAYWSPSTQWDWSVATNRIYGLWKAKMVGAAAALPSGTKMDVRLIVPWVGDNDAQSRSRYLLETSFKAAYQAMVKAMRYECAANDWTTLPAEMIPVVAPSIGPGYGGALAISQGLDVVAFCNNALAELASDDPYMRVVDSSEWTQLSEEPVAPPVGMGTGQTHESHNGHVQAAIDIYEAWIDIVRQSSDAISEADRITLSELMNEIRMRYDRSLVNSDLRDEVVIDFANKAIRHIVSVAGDLCWWLRRRTNMTLVFGTDGVASLPLHVARATWIEDPNDPTKNVPFQQIGYGDGGRCQIVLTDQWRGTSGTQTFKVNHIGWPLPVTVAEQDVPVPRQIMEWVVVEACKRMASGSTDIARFSLLVGEAKEIEQRSMRLVGAQHRQQRDALHAAQPRIQLRYS